MENNQYQKLMSIADASKSSGIGRNNLRLMAEEAHAVFRVGRKVLINMPILYAWIDSQTN